MVRAVGLVLFVLALGFQETAEADVISLDQWIASYPKYLDRYVQDFRDAMLSTGADQFPDQAAFQRWRQERYRMLGRIQGLQDLAAPVLDLADAPAIGTLPRGIGTFVERNGRFFIQGTIVQEERRLDTGAIRRKKVPFELAIGNVTAEHCATLAESGVDTYFWELTELGADRPRSLLTGTVNLHTEHGLWRKIKARHKNLHPVASGAVIVK